MSNTPISPDEVAERVRDDESEELFVLDVRNEDDYEEWRVPGSDNFPMYDDLLESDFSRLADSLDDLPEDEEIAVVCVGGVTSADAAEFLRDRGYDARSMDDGMRGWGRVHRAYEVEPADGVVQVVRPGTGCVSYVVHDGGEAVVVDPSQYVEEYLGLAEDRDLEIVGAVDTHAHADHVSGARRLAGELDVPYYLHGEDAGALDRYEPLEGGDELRVGDRTLEVVHSPGHTPGSVSLRTGDALLSGDTLFIESVGRPDLEDDDEDAVRAAASELFDSLDRLREFPDGTVVLPGHFSDEELRPLATELGDLRSDNELFGYVESGDQEAFVETVVESLSDAPANYNRIKHINWGEESPGADAESLELGPNNCAAN